MTRTITIRGPFNEIDNFLLFSRYHAIVTSNERIRLTFWSLTLRGAKRKVQRWIEIEDRKSKPLVLNENEL